MGQTTSDTAGQGSNPSGNVEEWKEKPLLYISGPMTSEGHPYNNIHNAVVIASLATKLGWAVQIPHLNALAEMITGDKDTINILDNDFNLLSRCDAVLVLPYTKEINDRGRPAGVAQELDLAESLDIPVYTVLTLPNGRDFDAMYSVTENN